MRIKTQNYDALTEQQRRFVDALLSGDNATSAYEKAGYKATGKRAGDSASRLQANARIQKALAEKRAEISKRNAVTHDEIVSNARAAIEIGLGRAPHFETVFVEGVPAGVEKVQRVYPGLFKSGLDTLMKFAPALEKDTEGGKPEEHTVNIQHYESQRDWDAIIAAAEQQGDEP